MPNATPRAIDDREAAEHLARCVATMVYYQADGWSWSGAQLLWEQTRSLLDWASGACSANDLGKYVLTPLQSELSARYGPDLGLKLHHEFLRAMHDASQP
jgi:hypothetical protein